jgi:hypothetical protein
MAYEFRARYDRSKAAILDEIFVDSKDTRMVNNLAHRLESTTKDSGARVMLVFTNSVLASRLLRAGDEAVIGGSGYAWLLNSNAMINVGSISYLTHADEAAETFGVLKTGSIGFLSENAAYLQQNKLADYTDVLTVCA